MSFALHELLVCCKGLENEKATERKKEAERFRRLIRSPEVVEELDRISGTRAAKGSKQLTWDLILRTLQKYQQKETELLQSGKANVSATTQANRRKKMQEISSLIKYFIRCANKNLLNLYCGLFTGSSKAINRVLLSRIIHTAVQGCCLQTEGLTHTLFCFFSRALLNARHEKHLPVVEHLVSALNVFLRSAAMNCRMRVCRLGEELLPSVLYVWTQMRPSTTLKEEIVDFFNLQLCVHHPKGAKTQDTGAYAEDWAKWQTFLSNLYDALVSEISQIGSRGKYATGTRHIAVKESLIELTADVCHQVIIATQKGSPQGTPSKRRRIELGWEVLRDHLQPHHSDFDIIPWLQIASVLISKYPSVVPGRELVLLLSVLCQLLGEQRRGDRGPYVLRCLREVACCQATHPERAQAYTAELVKLWGRVWALALRGVSSPQTEALSLALLSTVIQGALIPISREFWKLFSGLACKPSDAAALCLAQALLKCPVPKSLGAEWDHLGTVEGVGPPSLKESILSWLLMNEQTEEAEESSSPHPIICRDFPHKLIPRILVSLTVKDTRAGKYDPKNKSNMLHALSEIESLYLQFSFDEMPSEKDGMKLNGVRESSADTQHTVVPSLKNKLEQGLLSVADHLLNCYSPDSQTTPPECLVRGSSLLTGVLAGYVSFGLLTEEEACHSQLFLKAKALAQDFSEFISTVKVKMTDVVTMSSLTSVMRLCTQYVNRAVKVRQAFIFFLFLITITFTSSPTGELQLMPVSMFHPLLGAKSLLSEEHLSQHDLAFLASLEFLSLCASAECVYGLSFKPAEVRRKLLLLLEQMDFTKPLHLNMYLVLLKKLPAEDTLLAAEEFDSLIKPLADLCSLYRQDQEICAEVLLHLLPSIRCVGRIQDRNDDLKHVQGALLQVVSGFWSAPKTGKCTATTKAALVHCLLALLETDPCCKWAVLTLKEEELPVSDILPCYLSDPHHHVRMLTAMTVNRCMTPNGLESRKMLSLKKQQMAFENVYLKAQEGMRIQVSHSLLEDLSDETLNRRATLLKSVSVVLCCSPVCEKQSLFAVFQSYKENNIEEALIKKVLGCVSRALGYRSVEGFVSSHLDYLVTEWLGQPGYTLESFPYTLLNHATLNDFYSSSYQVLIPHLVFLDSFGQVKSIGDSLGEDWKKLLANCFPKIMVNILPYFALSSKDDQVVQQREKATRVYDLLKDSNCLGKPQIDSLIHSNLADIVVELLMTLYEGAATQEGCRGDLRSFIGELDPAPNPPYFSSYVIKATLDYLSNCHSDNHKSLVAILSKTPISIQRILLAVCQKAAETVNAYEKHRILLMYHLFVSLLLREVKNGLGGAWAFVLRDIIYTLIHHINSRPAQSDEVSSRSFSLCCDLLTSVCRTAVQFCDDALESHLQVIVGTLTAQLDNHPAVTQQVISLLKFLVIESQDKLKSAIQQLEPFPDRPEFRELRAVQHKLKYSKGEYTLRQVRRLTCYNPISE
uniref:Telomere-length maintenance and DNA damage repair domain-containing protein n=1 Tax=Esox lucius TaxID=8010 RepID=A0A6Q2YDU3_ESOLU